ncbi:hypothetical protein [Methylocystis echinoides]|uniref:hypothetical protein n=1 Tax=Methylocystis echinoides TaxID=29468 RepID=UPI003431F2BA
MIIPLFLLYVLNLPLDIIVRADCNFSRPPQRQAEAKTKSNGVNHINAVHKFLSVLCVPAHTGFVAIRRHATVFKAPLPYAPTRSRRSLETPLGGFTFVFSEAQSEGRPPDGFWKIEPPPAGFPPPVHNIVARSNAV